MTIDLRNANAKCYCCVGDWNKFLFIDEKCRGDNGCSFGCCSFSSVCSYDGTGDNAKAAAAEAPSVWIVFEEFAPKDFR